MIMNEWNRKRKKMLPNFLWGREPKTPSSSHHILVISTAIQSPLHPKPKTEEKRKNQTNKQTSKNNESVDPQSPTTTLILQVPVNNNHCTAPLPPHQQPPTPSISHHHPHGRGPEDIPGGRVEVAVEAHAGQEGQAAPQGPPLSRAPDLRDAQAGRAPGRRLRARAALGGRRAGPRLVLRPGRRAGQGPRRQVTMPCLSIIM